jgi:hypothetical protein
MEQVLNRSHDDLSLPLLSQKPEVSILSQLQQLEDFRQSRAHLLPSKVSMQWYVKRHKVDLIKAGAIVLSGRSWLVHPDRFDAVFLAIAQRNALRHLGDEVGSLDAQQ